MKTTPILLAKKKNAPQYVGVFQYGNGKAWNNIYELHHRAESEEEAYRWFANIRISQSDKPTKFAELTILPKPSYAPTLAGKDKAYAKDNYFIAINGGYTFIEEDTEMGGYIITANHGTRSKANERRRFIALHPICEFHNSREAGRGKKEVLIVERLADEWEVLIASPLGIGGVDVTRLLEAGKPLVLKWEKIIELQNKKEVK